MATVSLRFDDEMKKQQTAPLDPFYSDSNMEQLRKANQQVKSGQVIVKTMEELETMERE